MLCLTDLNVSVGRGTSLERSILKGLNLRVQQGEFVVLIGGNGAGKSTLFKAISGLIPLESGKIILDQTDITAWSCERRAKDIAKVLQDPRQATIANMSVEENLSFALKRGQRRGLALYKNKQRRSLFQEKLALLNMGLENRLFELTGNLSGGQRQALSLIMALMTGAKILLLDEITAALDPEMAQMMMALTTRIVAEERQTTIMITHNTAHMTGYGHRTLQLYQGQIISQDKGEIRA